MIDRPGLAGFLRTRRDADRAPLTQAVDALVAARSTPDAPEERR